LFRIFLARERKGEGGREGGRGEPMSFPCEDEALPYGGREGGKGEREEGGRILVHRKKRDEETTRRRRRRRSSKASS